MNWSPAALRAAIYASESGRTHEIYRRMLAERTMMTRLLDKDRRQSQSTDSSKGDLK